MNTTNESKPHIPWLLFFTAIIACRLAARYIFPTLDDAYITFRYARNLADGMGFVYNAGDWVQGVTCPGFGVLLAGVARLGIDLPTFVPLLNILIDVLIFITAVQLFFKTKRVTEIAIFGFLFAISPACNYICIGGMEVNLFLLLSLLSIQLYTTDKAVAAVALATVAIYIRPEAVLLVAILVTLLIATKQFQKCTVACILSLLIVAPYFIVSNVYYGTVIPQSILAKSNADAISVLYAIKRLFFIDYTGYVFVPIAATSIWLKPRMSTGLRVFIVWIGIYTLSYLIARPVISSWYTLPIQFALLVLAAIGLSAIIHKFEKFDDWLKAVPVWVIVMPSIILWLGAAYLYGPTPAKKFVFQPLRKFCVSNNLSNQTILAHDIGVLGYYSQAKIFDISGITWKSVMRDNSLAPAVRNLLPNYVMVSVIKDEIADMQSAQLKDLYRPVQRFSIVNDTNITPDITKLPKSYLLDYIIYKKVTTSDAPPRY